MKRRPRKAAPRSPKAASRLTRPTPRPRRPPPHEREHAALREEITALTGRLEALRKSEAKYRRLHDTRMDAFVSVSMDGRISEFNTVYQQMLGYPAHELLALTDVDLTPEKWHAFEADIIEKQVLVRDYSDVYEKEYRRKDGTVFPIEVRTMLIRDDDGNPI